MQFSEARPPLVLTNSPFSGGRAVIETQDTFGQFLVSCHRMEDTLEIIERDDGFIRVGDGSRYFTSPDDWPSHQKLAIKHVNGKVLDVGCGAGSHSIYCQNQGHSVLGIDISPPAIQVAQRRGLRDGKVMSVSEVDPSLGTFDTILMLGNNFGTFGDGKSAKRLLKQFHSMTSPSGRIIAETKDPHQTAEQCHKEYHKRNRALGRLSGQIRIRIRYKNYNTPWFDYLYVSKIEMKQIIEGTGWHIGNYIDTPGPGYIAVLEKT